MVEPICKNCGNCCYYIDTTKDLQTSKPCKYLIRFKDRTFCRIYHQKDRIGKQIGFNNKCILRKDSNWDYLNCPYNTNKPMIQREKKE
jgi:uncharacterized cysteine cluster protein YcgN (CxxCxxCC family)